MLIFGDNVDIEVSGFWWVNVLIFGRSYLEVLREDLLFNIEFFYLVILL